MLLSQNCYSHISFHTPSSHHPVLALLHLTGCSSIPTRSPQSAIYAFYSATGIPIYHTKLIIPSFLHSSSRLFTLPSPLGLLFGAQVVVLVILNSHQRSSVLFGAILIPNCSPSSPSLYWSFQPKNTSSDAPLWPVVAPPFLPDTLHCLYNLILIGS